MTGARWWRVAVLALALGALAAGAPADDDDADDGAAATRVTVVGDHTVVHVDRADHTRLGLRTETAAASGQVVERQVPGRVVDTTPIVVLHSEIRAAAERVVAADAAVAAQATVVDTLARLREQGLAIDVTEWHRERRNLVERRSAANAARLARDALGERAVAGWGAVIGGRIGTAADAFVDAIRSRARSVLVVDVRETDVAGLDAAVDAAGLRSAAVRGEWLGAAPVRSVVPGAATYFLSVAHPGLRPGMRVSVWLARPDAVHDGVIVDRGALLWHAGREWIYVEREPGVFERREAGSVRMTGDGAFVGSGVDVGERVVVGGAASLLGEEFRWSIPDEDDD